MEGSQQRPQEGGGRTRHDLIALVALGVGGFLATILTTPWYGMSWDEGYYFPCYENAWGWVRILLTNPAEAFTVAGIAKGWEFIDELPPVTRWLGAFFIAFAPRGWELETVRLFPALLFGGTLALIYSALRRSVPIGWAVAGALLYALHPRLFGHAHFAATETVFCFIVALVAWLGSRGLSGCSDRIWLALICGVSLATKVNGIILIIAVVMWLIGRNVIGNRRATWAADLRGVALVLVMAPVVAFLLWPLMWTDPIARLWNYFNFIRLHQHTPTWYLGARWAAEGAPNVPWHYPTVMTLVASPVLFLVAAGAGLFAAAQRFVSHHWKFDEYDLLLLLLFMGSFSASSLPGTPRYDSLRLFLPMFLPLAILIGRIGLQVPVWGKAGHLIQQRPVIAGLAAIHLILVLPSMGAGLRYYNEVTHLVTPNDDRFPFETMYWMEGLTDRVIREIDAEFPEGPVNLRVMAMHGYRLMVQQKWGRVPDRFVINGDPPYDAHLIQNRKGFWSRTERGFYRYRVPLRVWPEGSTNPYLLMYDGRPPDFPQEVPFSGSAPSPNLPHPSP